MPKKQPKQITKLIQIPPFVEDGAILRLIGESPIMFHGWTEKAREQMRKIHTGGEKKVTTKKKEKRNPKQEFEDAKYTTPDGKEGIPARNIKKCLMEAAVLFGNDVSKAMLGRIVRVGKTLELDEVIPFNGETSKAIMDERAVRLQGVTTDLRYRPRYDKWSVDVPIRWNSEILALEDLVNLVSHAGHYIGLCEFRPGKDGGTLGLFRVAQVDGKKK